MWFTQLLHTGQVALCAYGAYVSFIAIRNLQQYEETSKKAAKYSFEAERQLHKTRTTQSSGAICVGSILTSCFVSICILMSYLTDLGFNDRSYYTIAGA
jgi:hypothetical protein